MRQKTGHERLYVLGVRLFGVGLVFGAIRATFAVFAAHATHAGRNALPMRTHEPN